MLVVAPLLAFLFSISATRPLPRPALEPAFDAANAAALAAQIAAEYPSRVPGTSEAQAAAHWYRETLAALGFGVQEDAWRETLPDLGEVELRNIAAVVPGRSPETILLVAHRDNAGSTRPSADNASGTAVLVELARGFAPRQATPAPQPQRTLVFLSTDGGAYGGAGAARFARESPHVEEALATIVLDGPAASARPRIALVGTKAATAARTLVASAVARVEEQAAVEPRLPSLLTQLVDLGLPYAAGEQAPFVDAGVAAVTLGSEPGNDAGAGPGPTPERLEGLGRATEALLSSLDASAGAALQTPDSLFLGGRAASGWAARLALVVAVAPFALGALDLLARARRRRAPLLPAFRALRTRLLVWLSVFPLLWLAGLANVLPEGADLPPPPYTSAVVDPPLGALLVLALVLALVWLVGRRRLLPLEPPTGEERLAGYAAALLALAALAVLVAALRPYALVFLLPSLYAWLWLPARSSTPARLVLYALGLAGPVVGLLALGGELALGPGETLLYALALVGVGYLSSGAVLLALAWLAVAGQLGALAAGRYAPYAGGAEPPPPGTLRRGVAAAARRLR
ncbi:MAG TPA: M28 family peptidase [Gaiellaceae bacterium]|nr:M28 family peptidase [Gaiellaceae bacterium]